MRYKNKEYLFQAGIIMSRSTKIWLFILAAVCAASALVWFIIAGASSGAVAEITVNGEHYDTIDLSRVKEPYDIVITTRYGSNTVRVEPGKISVTQADCPDHICVRQGAITGSGIPIVCMPHRLYISIKGGDIDG